VSSLKALPKSLKSSPKPLTFLNVLFCLAGDLTWLFWTKLCEKLSLERSFGYAEEEVQR
jgi:hypothetical protein